MSSDDEILKQNYSLMNRHLYLIQYITCDSVHLPNKILTKHKISKVPDIEIRNSKPFNKITGIDE